MKIKNYCLMFFFFSNSIYAIELWLKVINNGQLMTNSCFEHQIIKNKGVHIKMRDSNDNYYNIPSNSHFFFSFSKEAITCYTSRDIELKKEVDSFNLNIPFSFTKLGNFKEGYCILIQNINSKWIICADSIEEQNEVTITLNQIKKLHSPIKTIVNNTLYFSHIPKVNKIPLLPGDLEESNIRAKMKKMISDTERKIEQSRIKLNQQLEKNKIEQEIAQRNAIMNFQKIKQNYRRKLIKEITSMNPRKCKVLLRDKKERVNYCSSNYGAEDITNCVDINQFCYYCCVKEMNIIGDESIRECNDNCINL